MRFPLSSTRNCPASVHPRENCWSQSTHSLQRAIGVVLLWKVKAMSVFYISFPEFNHAWPAALSLPDGTSSTATVVHALRRRLVATSPSTTWPDICHCHTRDGRLISNAVTKLVQTKISSKLHAPSGGGNSKFKSNKELVQTPNIEFQLSADIRRWTIKF